MNSITRGIRNAFRNSIRTISIVIILGLSIGLALTMLVARQAVEQKISAVKSAVGNTITIAPAGSNGFSEVSNALSTSDLAKVQALPHVSQLTETLTDRLSTIGSAAPTFRGQANANSNNQTSLTSPITFNINGNSSTDGGGRFFISGGGQLPTNFSPPIQIIGTNYPSQLNAQAGNSATLVSGILIDGSKDTNNAMVSSAMASKNNLKIGSTFTAYGTTLTVIGIFNSSTQAANDAIIVSLPTEQRLSGQSGDITNAVATVDSLDNLSSVTTAIKNTLGSAADVTSAIDEANQAVAPLNSVKNISLFSLIGALIAGAVIILLTMIMIVRERRREIGVLKAIGASNLKVMSQFMVEAVTLTVLGAVIGLGLGVIGGNPVTKLLVNNSTSSTSANATPGGGPGTGGPAVGGGTVTIRNFGGGGFTRRLGLNTASTSLRNIHAVVGWSLLLYGLAAAIVIALVGSSIATGLIAKVRPAEVMRAE